MIDMPVDTLSFAIVPVSDVKKAKADFIDLSVCGVCVAIILNYPSIMVSYLLWGRGWRGSVCLCLCVCASGVGGRREGRGG